jgi:hypothetical protein
MPADPPTTPWKFVRFKVFVTGRGEEEFIDRFLRSLSDSGHCSFMVQRIGQLRPRTSVKQKLKIAGTTKALPTRDEELGLHARSFINKGPDHFAVLVDDLEHDWRALRSKVYFRYRHALDQLLRDCAWRAGVFFLVNMLEAYYFAHAGATNAVLGTSLNDYEKDVEEIPHPKNELKSLVKGFDEVRHGKDIVSSLDLVHVLSRPETCASLRSLFGWCCKVMGELPGARYQLADGAYDAITGVQLARLRDRFSGTPATSQDH